MRYDRPPGAGQSDFKAAREFEETVGEWIGPFKVPQLDATDKMDYWLPGVFLDVKERKTILTSKWPVPAGCRHEDAFVLDELSIRRAIQHGYSAYFLFRDVPFDRVFLASLLEIICADHVRINRETTPGRFKGKWVLDLTQFRQIEDTEILPVVLADQISMPWKRSECIVQTTEDSSAHS